MIYSIAATFAVILIAMVFSGYRRRKSWRDQMQSLLGQSAQSLTDHKQKCNDCREILTSATHNMTSLQMAQMDTLCHAIDEITASADKQLQQIESIRVFLDEINID